MRIAICLCCLPLIAAVPTKDASKSAQCINLYPFSSTSALRRTRFARIDISVEVVLRGAGFAEPIVHLLCPLESPVPPVSLSVRDPPAFITPTLRESRILRCNVEQGLGP
jgi:hypothetical protein